jgi:hypothetical protein
MRTELLPCRHAIYWRIFASKSPIPISHIHPRWSLSCHLNLPVEYKEEEDEAACGSFRVRDSTLGSARHKVLNGTSKFRTAHTVGTRIVDIMSRNGTPVFKQLLESLERFESIVTDGATPFVSQVAVWPDQLSDFNSLSQVLDDTAISMTLIADLSASSHGSEGDLLAADIATTSGSDTHVESTRTPPESHNSGVTQPTSHTTSHNSGVTQTSSHTTSHTAIVTRGSSHFADTTSTPQDTTEDASGEIGSLHPLT